MRKVKAAINMTLDGFCDHTAISPDEEIHQHYTDLLKEGDVILYGRITYQLMEFWQPMVNNPTGEKSMDDFAQAIDKISKLVFSHTWNTSDFKTLEWESAKLAKGTLEDEVNALKQQSGKDIFVGCRSLIIQLLKLNLLDELQLCIHPIIVGKGLPLVENIHEMKMLKLTHTKVFGSGAIILTYHPEK
ncbi:MAG TPA: dihydrofolate reductase family protein [Flavobacteriales bacterium]|nr:dihydrofolate reductase family protein [Flavobacteriales bacterium]